MSVYLKSFEWKCENHFIMKIESINAYLGNQIGEARELEISSSRLVFVPTEESDIEYDEISNSLILVDNTDYWVTYDQKTSLVDVTVFENILTKKIDGKGILNSKNYVGILDFGCNDFSVVVKSKKVNYDRDFRFLRESISDFCSDLLSRSSSYFGEHFFKTEEYSGDKLNYSELAYLREMLRPDLFPAWIDYFLTHAEHKFVLEKRVKSIVEIDDVDAEAYLSALSREDVFKTNKVCGNAGKLGYAPNECDAEESIITFDTVENQFVKFFLLLINSYLLEVLEIVDISNSKLTSEVKKMQQIVSEKMEHSFWKNISDINTIPFNSQVLQKKYPYNLIFQMYTEFTLKSNIDLGELDRKYIAGQKDAPMLYQYWVFIMLFKYLANKFNHKYITSDWIAYDGKNLTFTLIEGRECIAKFFLNENTELHLLYNKTYDNNNVICSGRSYSHELKPDISLELFKENELVSIIHFDAKYRLPINGTDVPDDINKMHAYKDGIIGTIGSFAICLAEEPIIYHEEEKGWEKDGLFPAVGACPLNLNEKTLNKELNEIYSIVDAFTQIDIENNANRFSDKRLRSYYSLLRKMMEIKE